MEWRGRYQLLSISRQFLLLLVLLSGSFFVCYLVGMFPLLYVGVESLSNITIQNVHLFKWLQSWSSIGVFILPSVLFLYLIGDHRSIFKSINRQQVMLSIACMLLFIPIINFLAIWNEGLHLPTFLSEVEQWMRASEAKSASIMEYFLIMDSYGSLVVNIVVIALIPAIGEELLFRGVIQRQLFKWKNNPHFAIWLSALLFSTLHVQFLGFFPRFLIGGFFGYLFFWSGSIWLPIITHFTNNALAVLLLFYSSSLGIDMEAVGTKEGDFSIILVSIFAISLLLYLLYTFSKKKSPIDGDLIE